MFPFIRAQLVWSVPECSGTASSGSSYSWLVITHGVTCRIIAEFVNIQERALKVPEDSEELMQMVKFVENARSAGMVKLNERIKHTMDRLQYLMEAFLFEQLDLDLNAEVLLFFWVFLCFGKCYSDNTGIL